MTQHTTAELAIGSEFAGYRIEEVAARGGMGVVYRAVQLRLTRLVALKLVTPSLARDASFRERFRREWMIAASIEHPNVIPVYEAGEEDGALFIAMRWVEGTDLREAIDGAALEPSRAAGLVSQVANALDAAHESGLIHRDVKPANILITGQDHVYLTDFGLTKHASSISGLTRTGQWVGTVDYTAPEQIEGTPVTPRTDVYSLGCVLFEALTGRTPYKRENDLATLWAHVYAPPPSVLELAPDTPPDFEAVVQRAMAKDPEERYETASDLGRAALAAALGGQAPARERKAPTRERKAPAREGKAPAIRAPRWSTDRRLLVGLAGALILILAALAVVLLPGSDDPKTDPAASASSTPLRAGSWRRLPPMPTARQNMGSAVLDGTVWVVGGLSAGSEGSRQVEGYDPVINGWKSAPELPVRLHHQMTVTYKGELVVIGGWIPKGSDPSAEITDRVFALRNGRWAELPSLTRPRAAGAAAVVGDRIVVAGGQADGRLIDTTEVFDGEGWSTGAKIPTPREHLAAVSDGDYLYAVGGRALSPDKNSAALERYDPAADRWQRLADMPNARGGIGAAIAGGHLFAVGGETSTRALGTVESYSIARDAWSSAPSMRTPRHGLAVAAIGRTLYALGGAPRPGHASASATAEATRLVPGRPIGQGWRRLPPMPTARQNMGSAVLDGTVWVVGGLSAGSEGSRQVEGYDPVINGWKSAPELPVRLHHQMTVTYKGELVVIGGWIPKGSDPSAEITDRVFALRNGRWAELPSLRSPRAAGAAAVVGDRIVVAGGQADGRLIDTTEVFDGEGWSTGAKIPTPREHLAAVSDGDYLYAVGGRALSPDKNSAALERYDPAADRWQRLADMPNARGGIGAAIAGGHLFAVGGETSTRALGTVESYSIARDAWSSAPSMRTPRHGLAVAAIGRTLYALGGAPRPGHASASATAEVLRLTP